MLLCDAILDWRFVNLTIILLGRIQQCRSTSCVEIALAFFQQLIVMTKAEVAGLRRHYRLEDLLRPLPRAIAC